MNSHRTMPLVGHRAVSIGNAWCLDNTGADGPTNSFWGASKTHLYEAVRIDYNGPLKNASGDIRAVVASPVINHYELCSIVICQHYCWAMFHHKSIDATITNH